MAASSHLDLPGRQHCRLYVDVLASIAPRHRLRRMHHRLGGPVHLPILMVLFRMLVAPMD
jgi:hypothetical protein